MRRKAPRRTCILLLAFVMVLASTTFAYGRGPVSIDLKGADVRDVFAVLSDMAGVNIIIDPAVRGTITLRLTGETLENALDLVCRAIGVGHRTIGNTVFVAPQDVLAKIDGIKIEVFTLSYASPEDVKTALTLAVPAQSMQVDSRTRSIIVSGTDAQLAEVRRIIALLDVPVEKPEQIASTAGPAGAEATSIPAPAVELVPSPGAPSAPEAVPAVAPASAGSSASAPAAPAPEQAPPEPEPKKVFVVRLSHAPAAEVKSALSLLVSASEVMVDSRTNSLVLRIEPSRMPEISELVAALDIPVELPKPEPKPAPPEIETQVFRLSYAKPEDVMSVLKLVLPADSIQADQRTKSLVVKGDDAAITKAGQIIASVDIPVPQVYIEARLEEITADASRKLGFEWSIADLNIIKPEPNTIGLVVDYAKKLAALEESGDAVLLSRQHTFTADGQEGKILIGEKVPVVQEEVTDGQVTDKITYIEAGIKLSILPTVNARGEITAVVKPEVSSIIDWTPQGYPHIRSRQLETVVNIMDGQTIVIGGLFQREEIEALSKVPIIGDIPLIGEIFKKRQIEHKDTEIVIFLTARVIMPQDASGVDGSTTILPESKLGGKGMPELPEIQLPRYEGHLPGSLPIE